MIMSIVIIVFIFVIFNLFLYMGSLGINIKNVEIMKNSKLILKKIFS